MVNRHCAVLGISSECVDTGHIAYIVTNYPRSIIPAILTIPPQSMHYAKPGKLFSGTTGITMLFPDKTRDYVGHKRIREHSVAIYLLPQCNGISFELKKTDEHALLAEKIEARAKLRLSPPKEKKVHIFITSLVSDHYAIHRTTPLPLSPNTPCRDFFPPHAESLAFFIGKPIQETFGLECFNVQGGLNTHEFSGIPSDHAFYTKYPHELRRSDKFTLKLFCEMIYSLIRMRHGCE